MEVLFKVIEKFDRRFILIFNLGLIFALGYLDYITGYEIGITLFYLLPIVVITWANGRIPGILAAILSSAVWLWSAMEGEAYSHIFVPVWNTFAGLLLFLIIVYFILRIRAMLEYEKSVARTDELTGITNRRFFYEMLLIELGKAKRHGRALSIAYFDVDDFKNINDRLGHRAGDTFLKFTAKTIESNIRIGDIAARLGGDEFAVLFPETDSDQTKLAIEKIRTILAQGAENGRIKTTFSIGIATFNSFECGIDDIVSISDKIMYSVKKSGKNSVDHRIIP